MDIKQAKGDINVMTNFNMETLLYKRKTKNKVGGSSIEEKFNVRLKRKEENCRVPKHTTTFSIKKGKIKV